MAFNRKIISRKFFFMSLEMAVDILRSMIIQAITLMAPLMITAISVGVFVSLLQSVTSIQEQTLTFIPKLVAVSVVMMVSANWMIKNLVEFTIIFVQRLPDMAP